MAIPGKISLAAAALTLAACTAPPGQDPSTAGVQCEALFRDFDIAKATMSTPSGRDDERSIPSALWVEIERLRRADCLTRSGDLTLDESAAPVVEGGAAIRPAIVHAGVVTDMAAEARALDFFAARGAAPRSEGQAGLGRRIYLGPFTTAGGRDAALTLAREAGFESPYTVR